MEVRVAKEENIRETGMEERSLGNQKAEDRYVKVENIGAGANGTVFKAFDKHLGRYVAVKKVEKNEEWAWMEAAVLKQLKHMSIPIIYDVLKENEGISIVMEYMEGRNLLSVLEKGEALEEKRVVEIGIRIGECLCYLHNLPEKIIYRDLKPANLILDEEDMVKLIDFDSAFVGTGKGSGAIQTGTFGYSAPEQFEVKGNVDERSDIYGFGTTLYHMLTGKNPSKPPYRIHKIREVNPLVSENIERIVEKCMEQEREKRYRNMEEVLEELRNYDKKPKRRKRIKRNKRYMVEETKNIFFTGKRKGGLFAVMVLLFGFSLSGKEKIIWGNRAVYLPKTIHAREIQGGKEVLPLILYNQKREKIIIRDGTVYETDTDFQMAMPFSVLDGKGEIKITVVCEELESGKCMQKEVLIKAK